MSEIKAQDSMKVKKISMVEQVCNKIKECIKSGEWKVYTKIPSESDLSEAFGVNRLTVRMALQKLNTLGIVETCVGKGTFVKKFCFSNYIKEVSEFYMRPELLEDVCEFRKLLEIECARLAMERATSEDLDELKSICDEYDVIRVEINKTENLDERSFKEFIDIDLKFHEKVVEMSKNSLYLYSFETARESIYQYLRIIVKQRIENAMIKYGTRTMYDNGNLHRIIYQAIVDKDFAKCKKAYLDMVDHNVDL